MKQTQRIEVDGNRPDPASLSLAADILRAGGLVAIPTETVYGLAAHALDEEAVGRIYEAKGRPSRNPLIVHVAGVAEAQRWVADWPLAAEQLASRYWPGPLTLVLPKHPSISAVRATAGGATVALRVPDHPVAWALLQQCRLPLAAPSANRSEQVSPTTADHVLASLDGRIDLVLDAGPTTEGIESTVVDLTAEPRVLRPGPIDALAIERCVGPLAASQADPSGQGELRSPGMLARHYAPRAELWVTDSPEGVVRATVELGRRVVLIDYQSSVGGAIGEVIALPDDAVGYRRGLYAALHEADRRGAEVIIVRQPPLGDAWLAVHDRLRRAKSTPA